MSRYKIKLWFELDDNLRPSAMEGEAYVLNHVKTLLHSLGVEHAEVRVEDLAEEVAK